MPADIRDRMELLDLAVHSAAKWLGQATHHANHLPGQLSRDSEASRRSANEAAVLRARQRATRPPKVEPHQRQALLPADGGHLLRPFGHLWACEVCRHTGRWLSLAPFRCSGPAQLRWEQRAIRRAQAITITQTAPAPPRNHLTMVSGLVVWCNRCGSYAYTRAVLMARPCPGPPRDWRGGGRAQQLTSLRRNRHPRTRCALPPAVPAPPVGHSELPEAPPPANHLALPIVPAMLAGLPPAVPLPPPPPPPFLDNGAPALSPAAEAVQRLAGHGQCADPAVAPIAGLHPAQSLSAPPAPAILPGLRGIRDRIRARAAAAELASAAEQPEQRPPEQP